MGSKIDLHRNANQRARAVEPLSKRKKGSCHSKTREASKKRRRFARLSNCKDNDNGNVREHFIGETAGEIVICLPCPQVPEARMEEDKKMRKCLQVPEAKMEEDKKMRKKTKKKKKTVVSKNAASESESDKENVEREKEEKRKSALKKKCNTIPKLLGGSKCEGWSKEQDIALHNAYYTVKPVPDFWKQIAKLVPGKSSKECFNRFYSAFPTPPVSQPRSRSKGKNCESPIRSFANDVNTLLKSSGSTGGRSGSSKQKILHARKTVRQILRSHKNADKEYETDLFSAVETLDHSLESALIPITTVPVTPNCAQKPGREPIFNQTQSLNQLKALSRFSEDSHRQLQKQIVSPEVLKQVKNPALHDKYIDLLHSRDATRKASAQNTKSQSKSVQTGAVGLPQTQMVCAAKAAVVAEAQEVLRQLKANVKNDFLGNEDCEEGCEEEEGCKEDDGEGLEIFVDLT